MTTFGFKWVARRASTLTRGEMFRVTRGGRGEVVNRVETVDRQLRVFVSEPGGVVRDEPIILPPTKTVYVQMMGFGA